MACKALPPADLLHKVLDYDPETGILRWKARTPDMFEDRPSRSAEHNCAVWNAHYAGEPIRSGKPNGGYLSVCLYGSFYMAHRVVWKMIHGSDPKGEIDHIDGVRRNNRIANLRDVARVENTRNRGRPKTNTSGALGVGWAPDRSAWRAQMVVGGRRICLGSFRNLEDAIRARKQAEEKYGFHRNHGRG